MPVREENIEVVLGAASRVLNGREGEISYSETQRLCSHLEERSSRYTGRHPILGLLSELHSAVDISNNAATEPDSVVNGKSKGPNLGWDEHLCRFDSPMSNEWAGAIRESASEATRQHFRKATTCFEGEMPLQGAEHLASGIICSIAAIAALKGWPHADREDDLNTVVGLATGRLPQDAGQIYTLLQSASAEGQYLNSAYAAAMGQPEEIRYRFFYDGSESYEKDAVLFAHRAVELAGQLAAGLS